MIEDVTVVLEGKDTPYSLGTIELTLASLVEQLDSTDQAFLFDLLKAEVEKPPPCVECGDPSVNKIGHPRCGPCYVQNKC